MGGSTSSFVAKIYMQAHETITPIANYSSSQNVETVHNVFAISKQTVLQYFLETLDNLHSKIKFILENENNNRRFPNPT